MLPSGQVCKSLPIHSGVPVTHMLTKSDFKPPSVLCTSEYYSWRHAFMFMILNARLRVGAR